LGAADLKRTGKDTWALLVNRQTGQWGTYYDESQDLGRTKMKVSSMDSPLEEFTIEITPGDGHKAMLSMKWERTVATVSVMMH